MNVGVQGIITYAVCSQVFVSIERVGIKIVGDPLDLGLGELRPKRAFDKQSLGFRKDVPSNSS